MTDENSTAISFDQPDYLRDVVNWGKVTIPYHLRDAKLSVRCLVRTGRVKDARFTVVYDPEPVIDDMGWKKT